MMLVGVKEYNVALIVWSVIILNGVIFMLPYIPCTLYCTGRYAWGCMRPYIQILFLGRMVCNPTIAS